MSYVNILNGFTQRVYLNTVINISRTQHTHTPAFRKKNIHAHNYDTFALFARAGQQTQVCFFPPEDYRRFQVRLVTAGPGVLLLVPDPQTLSEAVFAQARRCDMLRAGDMIYTPPLWFHCFQHSGEYMNLANGEYFPELLAPRLARIEPEIYGSDWQTIRTQTETLLQDAMRPAPSTHRP